MNVSDQYSIFTRIYQDQCQIYHPMHAPGIVSAVSDLNPLVTRDSNKLGGGRKCLVGEGVCHLRFPRWLRKVIHIDTAGTHVMHGDSDLSGRLQRFDFGGVGTGSVSPNISSATK